MCSDQIRILKKYGLIIDKEEHGNICAHNIRNGNPLKDMTNVDFTQEMMERVDVSVGAI